MSEMLCVVTPKNEFIKEEDRKIVHSSKLWHRGVHVFLYNSKGQLILPLRSSKKDKFPNTIDCSISEHIHKDEDYESAEKRGLREESNVENVRLKELTHFRMKYGRND